LNNKTLSDLKFDISELIEDLGYDAGTPNLTTNNSTSNKNDYVSVSASVTGMTCSHCTNTIEKALKELPFVDPKSVEVSLDEELASMQFVNPDESITKDKIKDTIENLGYDVGQVTFSYSLKQDDYSEGTVLNESTQTAVFSLSGMTCQYCVKTVSGALQKLPGVIPGSVLISLENRKGIFSFQGDKINASLIQQVIEDLGYDLNGKPHFRSGMRRESLELSKSFTTQVSIDMPDSNESAPLLKNENQNGGKRKVVMRVLGMTCHSCVASVTDALQHELPNVDPESVYVNLQTEMAMFICTNPDINRIHNAVEERGFDVENVQIIHNLTPPAVLLAQKQDDPNRHNSITSLDAVSIDTQTVSAPYKVTFQISGMTCASCVRTIERGLVKLPGVDPSSVQVNLLTHSGTFSVSGDMLDEQMIIKAVKNMGYTASKVVFISNTSTDTTPTSTMAVYKAEMIITGMYCPNCIEKVHSSLVKLHGIRPKSIQIDLDSGCSSFEFSGEFVTRQRIYQAILQLGFSAESIKIAKISDHGDSDTASISSQKSSRFVSTHLVVTGMTCSSCVANIERTIMKQAGVVSCQVNLLSKSAVIKHDPTVVGARSLAQMIEQIGYKAELAQDTQGNTIAEQRASMRESMDKELAVLKGRFLWSLLFAIPVVLISMIFMMALPASNPVHKAFMKQIVHGLSIGDLILFLLATPVQFWLGLPFYTKAYKSLVYAHTANMETLVAMGTTVAYLASVASVIAAMVRRTAGAMSLNYFETAVLLITFIHFGKWLEALAKGKTAETITKLMDLQPEKATLVEVSKNPSRHNINRTESTLSTDSGKNVTEIEEVLTEREIDSKDIQGIKNYMKLHINLFLTLSIL
jgi:Cu+-exporting ATPase